MSEGSQLCEAAASLGCFLWQCSSMCATDHQANFKGLETYSHTCERERAEEMSLCSLLNNDRGYIMQLSWVISRSKSSLFLSLKCFYQVSNLCFLFLLGN